MALPDQDLPGQLVHTIRRTVDGIFYLSPRPNCVRGLAYTYGLGVEASGIMPHVELTMSNHRHGVFTCLTGLRSEFHQRHHGVFAQQYNGRLGRSGYMWDHRGPTKPVLLCEPGEEQKFAFAAGESKKERDLWFSRWDEQGLDTVERTIVYCLLNPVSANLVQEVRSFPGFKITPSDWGKWSVNARPSWFERDYPDVTAFMALPPPQWWDNAEFVPTGDSRFVVSPETLAKFEARREWAKRNNPTGEARFDAAAFELFISRERLAEAIAHYEGLVELFEAQFLQERLAAGKRVLGRGALRKQDPFFAPAGPNPIRRNSRYKPRFIGSAAAVQKAHTAYRNFCSNYWTATTLLKTTRNFNITFPAGTVRMALVANVCCRGAPLPEENPML